MFTRLLIAAVAGTAATIAIASPALAHTAKFDRDCDSVTVHLTKFAKSSADDPNVVDIYVDDAKVDTVTFTGTGTDHVLNGVTGTKFKAVWNKTGADDHSGQGQATLVKPKDCEQPTTTPTPEPTTPAPTTAAPTVEPVVVTTPAPDQALAVTGQNVALFVVAGAVLIALGAGAVIFTRRRKAVPASGATDETTTDVDTKDDAKGDDKK